MRKLLGMIGIVLGVAILLTLVVVAEENLRGQWAWRRVSDRLRAQHEPLTLAELSLPDFSRGKDAGAAVAAAGNELQKLAENNPIASKGPRGMMGWAAPGQAVARHRDPTFSALYARYQSAKGGASPVYQWTQLERELANADAPLAKLRDALRQPDAAPAVDYNKALARVPPSLPWDTFMWLTSAGMDALHAGNLDAVTDDCEALFSLAEYQRRDFRVEPQVTTIVMDEFALPLLWEALQEDGWSDAQLARIQSALDREHPLDDALRSVELGRTQLPIQYAQIRQSQTGLMLAFRMEGRNLMDDLMGDSAVPFPSEKLLWWRAMLWRAAWSRQDESRALENWQEFLVNARQLPREKSWTAFARRYPKGEVPLHGLALWRGSLSETLGPEIGRKLLLRAARLEASRQIMRAAIALKRYTRRTGAAPPALAALVPEFLPSVPTDYMDGNPLRYRAADGKNFALYSVGIDGRDDGGDPTPGNASKPHDLWTGRDAVWPTAVTPPSTAKSP